MIHYFNDGPRDYIRNPVAINPRRSWELQCVLSGDIAPTFIAGAAPNTTPVPALWIFSPNQLHGWTSQKGGTAVVFHTHQVPRVLQRTVDEYACYPLQATDVATIELLAQQTKASLRHPTALTPLIHQQIITQVCLLYLQSLPEFQYRSASVPKQTVEQALGWLDANMHSGVGIQEICHELKLSKAHLRRLFHEVTGGSPRAAIRQARLERAQTLLKTAHLNQTEIASACGLSSVQAFSRFFRSMTKMSPEQWRKNLL